MDVKVNKSKYFII